MDTTPRHDWRKEEVAKLYALPFNELLFQAQTVHRAHFNPNEVQLATLLNVKTGACPEDCKYCSQSVHYNTGLEREKLMSVDTVLAEAKKAKANGATRFCMGAAWRRPTKRNLDHMIEMVKEVKALGMEACVTLGSLNKEQAQDLKDAGLDYYNHNLDTSPEYYPEIITTRTYEERLETLANVRDADLKTCCGGIIGLGETLDDRIGLLVQLANLPIQPESVPINQLVPVPGTPLGDKEVIGEFDYIRTIAVARIMMPKSYVRLSAGRESMPATMQALCFFAGANSIFLGDKLLTVANLSANEDLALLKKLGITPQTLVEKTCEPATVE